MERHAQRRAARRCGITDPSNIYLDRLDKFVETVLIPEYTRGERRARNPAYREVDRQRSRVPADAATVPRCGSCASSCAACPARIPTIPATGGCATCGTPMITSSGSPDRRPKPRRSKHASRRSCVMTSSWNSREDKTLITHARTGAATFLGYEITVQHSDHEITRAAERSTASIGLRVPTSGDQGQVRPVPQARQTRAPDPSC